MTKHQQIRELIGAIHKQMPMDASNTTFSACANECGEMARGGNECAACLERELQSLTDFHRAQAFTQAITMYNAARRALFEGKEGES